MKKLPTPNPKLQRNSKFKIPMIVFPTQPATAITEMWARSSADRSGAWDLEFLWGLELGVWDLCRSSKPGN